MKKLNTALNGGWPLSLDDYRFWDDGIREAFQGFLSAFGASPDDSFVLSGAEVSGAGNNYTDGFVCINGEICKVNAGLAGIILSGESLFWIIDETDADASGDKQFEDGNVKHKYLTRIAYPKRLPTATTGWPLAPLRNIFAIDDWHAVGAGGEPAFQNGWINFGNLLGNPVQELQFKKIGNKVTIRGVVKSGTLGQAIFTLPAAYVPSSIQIIPSVIGDGAAQIFITASGDVSLNGVGGASANTGSCYAEFYII